MASRRPYLASNPGLAWNYRLGVQGFGLVLYGALPASLAAIGALKPLEAVHFSVNSPIAIALLVLVAGIPVLITYVLVRQRLRAWYLLSDFLTARSLFITACIVLLSTSVCLGTGVLGGKYRVMPISEWWVLPLDERLRPFATCLLASFGYMVGSSTLFITVIKEDSGLPLLPSKNYVERIAKLRVHLSSFQSSLVWNSDFGDGLEVKNSLVTTMRNILVGAQTEADALKHFAGLGQKRFFQTVSEQIGAADKAAASVEQTPPTWRYYFGNQDPQTIGTEEKRRRLAIQHLKGMRTGGQAH